MWGCDIDAPSIEWLQANLSPPLHVFVNGVEPPLPGHRRTTFFDVVFASSVFTHISDEWARWLVELHRVLRPGGVLLATFLGNGMSDLIAREPWDEDRIGMNVLLQWQGWDDGGPCVLHSPWWLRAHWGRIFDARADRRGARAEHPRPGRRAQGRSAGTDRRGARGARARTSRARSRRCATTSASSSARRPTSPRPGRGRRRAGARQRGCWRAPAGGGRVRPTEPRRARSIRSARGGSSRRRAAASWGGRIRTSDRGTKTRCLTTWPRPTVLRAQCRRGTCAMTSSPCRRSQACPSRQSGSERSTSAQKRGEWSRRSRWQSSCTTT